MIQFDMRFLRAVIDECVPAKHLCGRLDWLKALIHFGTSIVAFEGRFIVAPT
jgi:hypothetical protein